MKKFLQKYKPIIDFHRYIIKQKALFLNPGITLLPVKYFLVICQARTGSTMLLDMLSNHPRIWCDMHSFYGYEMTSLPFFVLKQKRVFSRKNVWGYKLALDCCRDETARKKTEEFLKTAHESGVALIHLKREDKLRQVVSSYLYKEGRIHYTKGKPQHQDIRVDLDISSVIDKIRYRIKLEETANKILIDIPHVTLTYEKDLIDEEKQEKAYSLLLDMLKLRKIPRASRYHKGDDVLNSVVNINDIKEELRKIDLC